jgi:hypothetical protein
LIGPVYWGEVTEILGIVSMYFLGKEVGGRNAGLGVSFLAAENIYYNLLFAAAKILGVTVSNDLSLFLFFIRFNEIAVYRISK